MSVSKEFGVLGIPSIRDLDICLLGSWLKRYQADTDKLWREVIFERMERGNRL